jgi:hypothetical protein
VKIPSSPELVQAATGGFEFPLLCLHWFENTLCFQARARVLHPISTLLLLLFLTAHHIVDPCERLSC